MQAVRGIQGSDPRYVPEGLRCSQALHCLRWPGKWGAMFLLIFYQYSADSRLILNYFGAQQPGVPSVRMGFNADGAA